MEKGGNSGSQVTTDNFNRVWLGSGEFKYEYDALNRLTKEICPDGNYIQYTYDSLGRRTTMRDPDAYTHTYNYNATTARLSSIQNYWSGTTSYGYDSYGRLTSMGYSNGATIGYTYDDLDRLDTLTNRDSASAILSSFDYTYNKDSNRTRADIQRSGGFIGAKIYEYDTVHRLTKEEKQNQSQQVLYRYTYQYDGVGNRTQKVYFNGTNTYTTNYTYNNLNQLTQATGAEAQYYTYDYNGNLTYRGAQAYPQYDFNFQYNVDDRMTYVLNKPAGNLSTNLVYDALGRRLLRKDHDGTWKVYYYDGLKELLERTSSYGAKVTTDDFNRESVGSGWSCRKGNNNWQIVGSSYLWGSQASGENVLLNNQAGKVATPTIEAMVFPETGGGMIFAEILFGYEHAGHYFTAGMQSSGATRYWVIREVGGTGEFFYTQTSDPAGTWYKLRVVVQSIQVSLQKWTGTDWVTVCSGSFEKGIPEGNVGFALYSSSARFDNFQVDYNGYTWYTTTQFTLGPGAVGGIISERSASTNKWYHYDAIGNVMELTNQSGLQYLTYEQEAFGNVLSGTQSGYHLTTKEYDSDIALYYFWARWCDPTIGRFTQRDPTLDRLLLREYSFCSNSPTMRSDPNGLKPTPSEKQAERECKKKCKPEKGGCLTQAVQRCNCFALCMDEKGIFCFSRLWHGTWPIFSPCDIPSIIISPAHYPCIQHYQCQYDCGWGWKTFDPYPHILWPIGQPEPIQV